MRVYSITMSILFIVLTTLILPVILFTSLAVLAARVGRMILQGVATAMLSLGDRPGSSGTVEHRDTGNGG